MTREKYYAAVVENKGIFGVGTSEEGALLKAMDNIILHDEQLRKLLMEVIHYGRQ